MAVSARRLSLAVAAGLTVMIALVALKSIQNAATELPSGAPGCRLGEVASWRATGRTLGRDVTVGYLSTGTEQTVSFYWNDGRTTQMASLLEYRRAGTWHRLAGPLSGSLGSGFGFKTDPLGSAHQFVKVNVVFAQSERVCTGVFGRRVLPVRSWRASEFTGGVSRVDTDFTFACTSRNSMPLSSLKWFANSVPAVFADSFRIDGVALQSQVAGMTGNHVSVKYVFAAASGSAADSGSRLCGRGALPTRAGMVRAVN